MELLAVCLAYALCAVMLIGGLLSLFLGFRMVGHRRRGGSLSGSIGGFQFNLSAGSIAAFCLGISVIWVGAGVLSRPKIEFVSNGHPDRLGGFKFLTQVVPIDGSSKGLERKIEYMASAAIERAAQREAVSLVEAREQELAAALPPLPEIPPTAAMQEEFLEDRRGMSERGASEHRNARDAAAEERSGPRRDE